jgi:LysR family transcriptional regulator, transcriptional activator of nhaA
MIKLDQLNFHHLFYFWRVAQMGHLTRAAKDLHLSQSALSSQIRQLEDRLGEQLFTREGRGLVLTHTGQFVLSYAENIFGMSREMLSRLEGHSEGSARLRIGSVATLSRNYQENRIRPLLAHPTVCLTLESGQLEDLLDRLTQHQLDVVLANETVPSNVNRPLHCHFLGSQAVSLVGSAHIWQPHSLRIPDDLDGLDIVLPGPSSTIRMQFDAMCASAKVTPRLRAEVDDMAMLRLIARDSGWVTVVSEVVVQDELQSGSLVCVGESSLLREYFYAITTPTRHRVELLDRLLANTREAH